MWTCKWLDLQTLGYQPVINYAQKSSRSLIVMILGNFTIPFMVFNVMYTICKELQLKCPKILEMACSLIANMTLFAHISDFCIENVLIFLILSLRGENKE